MSGLHHNLFSTNSIQLCGVSWSPCGYCKGARAHLSSAAAQEDVEEVESIPSPTNHNSNHPAHKQQQQPLNHETTIHAVSKKKHVASSKSYSVVASHLTPRLYERLIGKGWRRSGTAIYKPDNPSSCCPALTIRLPVAAFIPTKSQSKVKRRVASLLRPQQQDTLLSQRSSTLDDNDTATAVKQQKRWRRRRSKTGEGTTAWIRALLDRSGVLTRLNEQVKSALTTILSANYQSGSASIQHHIPTVNFKVLPRKDGSHAKAAERNSNGGDNDEVVVSVFSSVCAAVAGRSKGSIDKSLLSKRVAEMLQETLIGKESNTVAATSDTGDSNTGVIIGFITHHASSGHVQVRCRLRKDDRMSTSDSTVGHASVESALPSPILDDVSMSDAAESPKLDRIAGWCHAEGKSALGPLSPPYEISVKVVPAHESALDPLVHRLYFLYQHVVHDDPDPFLYRASTTTTKSSSIEEDDDGNAYFNEDWGRGAQSPNGFRDAADEMLRREYQNLPTEVQDQLAKTYSSFYEFLVESPFAQDSSSSESTKTALGTFHHHYVVSPGNLLIAVGVVDVLPNGLSSVYLFYDPSFAHTLAPLGKYAILREIEWTQKAELDYYYLGYYIESCPKMKYKGDYKPSEMLCPMTYKWVNAEKAKDTLMKHSPLHHCCELYKPSSCPEETTITGSNNHISRSPREQVSSNTVLKRIGMDVGVGSPVTLGMLQPEGRSLVQPLLEEFMNHAGGDVAVACTINFQ